MDEFNETFEQLELLIGRENATKVVVFFEGTNIYFPKRIGLNELHERIYSELKQGATYRQVSAKYGYTKSYIRKIERKKHNEKKGKAGRAASPSVANKDIRARARHKTSGIKPFLQGELFYER